MFDLYFLKSLNFVVHPAFMLKKFLSCLFNIIISFNLGGCFIHIIIKHIKKNNNFLNFINITLI